MNEGKKARYEYFNPSVSANQQNAESLAAVISSFINKTTMKPADWIALQSLLKQLKKSNNNMPRKVLRSIENKFNKIQQNYQR